MFFSNNDALVSMVTGEFIEEVSDYQFLQDFNFQLPGRTPHTKFYRLVHQPLIQCQHSVSLSFRDCQCFLLSRKWQYKDMINYEVGNFGIKKEVHPVVFVVYSKT
jgi:hypothetical protein